MRSRLLAALLSLVLLAAPSAPAVGAQDATGLDSIRATYRGLLELFYRPLAPRNLLLAGWAALTSDAQQRGAPVPMPLPELPEDSDAAFEVFATAYATYVANLPPTRLGAAAADVVHSGMTNSTQERHTHYLPPPIMHGLLTRVGGGQQAIGLGIRLGGDPVGLIVDVAPGGPAATAGLQPGDVIIRADVTDLSNPTPATLVAALTGPEGSTIALTIDRGSGPQVVRVTRGAYYFPPLESRLLPGRVGYLRLTDFVIAGTTLPDGTELLSELDRRLHDLDAQGAQSLILDLRNNGGGSVQTADELLGRFLPDTVRSIHEYDERGRVTYELASGRVHPRQLPMAVMINDRSASASEVTAAALRDTNRAVLVGQRSAGAVASSLLVPLPGGGGLQVAVAAARAGTSESDLDGVGVDPDVPAAQPRTLADYRSGRDPQLDVAVAALAKAPPPTGISADPSPIIPSEVATTLEGVLPASDEVPTNDRLIVSRRWQRLDLTHPNQLVNQNGGSPDPVGLQQTVRARGYQGSVLASYGAAPGDLPSVTVTADLYATADGAHSAVSTNDQTILLQPIDPPAQAGDESVAYRGSWLATGSTLLSWRRDRVVITVTYSDAPGFDRPATLAAIAQLVDARAEQLPSSP